MKKASGDWLIKFNLNSALVASTTHQQAQKSLALVLRLMQLCVCVRECMFEECIFNAFNEVKVRK